MTQKNPINEFFGAFGDFSKNWSQQTPFDTEALTSIARKNWEVVQEAAQAVAEGAQEIVKRQMEIVQNNAESALNLFREIAGSSDPRESAAKQAEFAKSAFQSATEQANELAEIASRSSSKAAEIVGKQVTDNIRQISKAASNAAAAAGAKKPSKVA